jgi:hypothetical protein
MFKVRRGKSWTCTKPGQFKLGAETLTGFRRVLEQDRGKDHSDDHWKCEPGGCFE